MQAFANGVLAGPVRFSQGAINDDDEGCAAQIVRSGECAPANDRDSLRLKVVAQDLTHPGQIQARALGSDVAFGCKCGANVASGCGENRGSTDGLCAG